jgi:hypothetical protein
MREAFEFETWRAFYEFSSSVKYENRYLLSEKSLKFLETLYASAEQRTEIFQEVKVLYRSQLGNDYEEYLIEDKVPIDIEVSFKKSRMLPRPKVAREGRANSKGIPVLYASDDRDTALAESRPWLGSYISIAALKLKRELKIVNFRSVYKDFVYFLEEPETEKRDRAVWKKIDNAFAQPNVRSEENADYSATQVIAEYFKSKQYDGIAYRSSLGSGLNVALFDIDCVEVVGLKLFQPEEIKFKFKESIFPGRSD